MSTHNMASNEYPQHVFSWRNKKNIYLNIRLIWIYDNFIVGKISICRQQICNYFVLDYTGKRTMAVMIGNMVCRLT